MAQIPDGMSQGEREIARRRVPEFQNRGPEIEARAIGAVADNLHDQARRFEHNRDNWDIGMANSALLQADHEIRKELETDADYKTHESRYSERMKQAREKVTEGIGSPRAKAIFDQAANADFLRGVEVIRGNARKMEGQQERSNLDVSLDANRRAALETSDPATRDALVQSTTASIEGALAKGYISPEQATQVRQAWAASYGEGFVEMKPAAEQATLLKNPKGTPADFIDPAKRAQMLKLAEHNAGVEKVDATSTAIVKAFEKDTGAGQAALKELDKSGFSDEDKMRVRVQVRQGQGLIHAERRQEFAEQVNDLERRISIGAPGQNAELDAKALYRRGVYTPEQYTNVLQSIDAARQSGAKDTASIVSFEAALAAGERLDPRDTKVKEAADKWFTTGTEINQVKPGTDEWINAAAGVMEKTNILPDSAMSWARKNLLSGDPKLSVPAANAMTRWTEANPASNVYFDDQNMKAFAEQLDGLVRAGTSPEQATKLAHDNVYTQPKEKRDRLEDDYKKQKYAADNAGKLQGFLNSDDNFDRALLSGAPDAPTQAGTGARAMVDEYELLVRSYFGKTNGSIDDARELAWKDIRGTYGYSTVNGAPEILKYAPEVRFPGIDVGVIRSDVEEVAKSLGVTTPVKLTPARVTGDSQGLLWELSTTDADGTQEILLDAQNRPLRYAIPTDTAAYVRVQEESKRKAVDAARTESKRRREFAEIDKLVEQAVSLR